MMLQLGILLTSRKPRSKQGIAGSAPSPHPENWNWLPFFKLAAQQVQCGGHRSCMNKLVAAPGTA